LFGVGLQLGGLDHVANLEVFVRDDVGFWHEVKSGLVGVVESLATGTFIAVRCAAMPTHKSPRRSVTLPMVLFMWARALAW
jgi:hypothetical protein